MSRTFQNISSLYTATKPLKVHQLGKSDLRMQFPAYTKGITASQIPSPAPHFALETSPARQEPKGTRSHQPNSTPQQEKKRAAYLEESPAAMEMISAAEEPAE